MQSPKLALPIFGIAHVCTQAPILHLGQKQTPQAKLHPHKQNITDVLRCLVKHLLPLVMS